MKKLYSRKVTVHPSPPLISDHHLAFLPATILTLAAALSPEDREVLAYLISCSSSANHQIRNNNTTNNNKKLITTSSSSSSGRRDHPPSFNCNCFRCYTSYWVRWDSSPSRQTIHEIIDAFEEEQLGGQIRKQREKSSSSSMRERRNKRGGSKSELKRDHESVVGLSQDGLGESESVEEISSIGGGGGDEGDDQGVEKGSVRKFVSFVGEKIWSTVWS